MITSPPNAPRAIDTFEVVWTPHRDAPSLLGEGWTGCSLSGTAPEPFTGNRGAVRRQVPIHYATTMARAKAETRCG